MRIVAWNSCQKFATNLPHLLDLGFDVAVVTECAPTSPAAEGAREVTAMFHAPVPPSPKCIGVLARAPWRVSPLPTAGVDLPWLLPVAVTGPVSFTLLAVWPVKFPGAPSYTTQLARVLDTAFPVGRTPVVLAGDLNAPTIATAAAHRRNVSRLGELGLHSAFTATRESGSSVGGGAAGDSADVEPTYYHLRRRADGFHIDHVFVPKEWVIESFQVGSFETWVASGRSDHVPLVADLRS